jgi:NADPH2:quinone reductase
VVEVFPGAESRFKPGDEVFGMAHADRGAAWAEYAVVKDEEVALKPAGLGWEEAAALPLSGLTGFEALFEKAGLDVPVLETGGGLNLHSKKVLITGAAGGVGVYLVQLAAIAGLHVVAATSSNARNEEFLRELGADETVEYGELVTGQDCRFDVIVDTVGGNVLAECWGFVKDDGVLVSVDSASFDFVRVHGERGIRKEGVRALFFIVEPSRPALEALARFAEMGRLRSFVLDTYPLAKAEEAYERASGRVSGRGKIVLVV